MNSDRELLEQAAKAAGYNIVSWYGEGEPDGPWATCSPRPTENVGWNPLTDDGDALRLAVKLKLFGGNYGMDSAQFEDGDPYAATRRAIVRAAAEIGRSMP